MSDDDTAKPRHEGQWQPGQSGNPKGRMRRTTEAKYLDMTMSKCSVEDWGVIIERAVRDAKNGSDVARLFLARYIIGEPVTVHEHLREERRDITIRVEFVNPAQLPSGETVDGQVRPLLFEPAAELLAGDLLALDDEEVGVV